MKSRLQFSLALITSSPYFPRVVKPLAALVEEIWQHSMPVPEGLPADLKTGCLNIDFADYQQDAWQYLSPLELERAQCLHNKNDVATFVLVHAFLRLLLSQRLKMQLPDVEFEAGVHGKPKLVSANMQLHFNISYRRGIFAIAIGETPVGIDIEIHQDDIDGAGIAERLFAAEEKHALQLITEQQEAKYLFFSIWSRKEAVVKLFGRSLDDFSQFNVHETHSNIKNSSWSDENYCCFSLPAPICHSLAMAVCL